MKSFKFLTDNDDEDIELFNEWDNVDLDGIAQEEEFILRQIYDDDNDSASWMWDDGYVTINAETQPYELVSNVYEGIIDFLAQFPPRYVVIVHEIRGIASGRTHMADSEREGWGFNIQEDMIEVTHYKFLNTDHA